MIILLDSGPVGLLAHSRSTVSLAKACNAWAEGLLLGGHRLIVPGIIDYEVRRELLRLGNLLALTKLNQLRLRLDDAPVSVDVLDKAADYWAVARHTGRQTADHRHLDIDMVLAGHAAVVAQENAGSEIVVATTNVKHLRHFADARDWATITG
jgi:hypothetical protein